MNLAERLPTVLNMLVAVSLAVLLLTDTEPVGAGNLDAAVLYSALWAAAKVATRMPMLSAAFAAWWMTSGGCELARRRP